MNYLLSFLFVSMKAKTNFLRWIGYMSFTKDHTKLIFLVLPLNFLINFLSYCYQVSCQNVCDALSYLLDNIYIRFGTKLYRQIVEIPMGTNSALLVADLFLYCNERDFMDSLNHDNQADVIEAFYSTSRYLNDLLNIDNPYFEGMVKQIYRPELQLNKANNTDTEVPFLDLHLSIANGFVSSKIYDKRDDFDFDIVNFRFWMVTFLAMLLMAYTFHNLLGLLESAIMLRTSMQEINV